MITHIPSLAELQHFRLFPQDLKSDSGGNFDLLLRVEAREKTARTVVAVANANKTDMSSADGDSFVRWWAIGWLYAAWNLEVLRTCADEDYAEWTVMPYRRGFEIARDVLRFATEECAKGDGESAVARVAERIDGAFDEIATADEGPRCLGLFLERVALHIWPYLPLISLGEDLAFAELLVKGVSDQRDLPFAPPRAKASAESALVYLEHLDDALRRVAGRYGAGPADYAIVASLVGDVVETIAPDHHVPRSRRLSAPKARQLVCDGIKRMRRETNRRRTPKRGRPPESDPDWDEKLVNDWKQSGLTQKEFESERSGVESGDIRRAQDRIRRRESRAGTGKRQGPPN